MKTSIPGFSIYICYIAAAVLIGFQSCVVNYKFRNNYYDANAMLHETSNLKDKPFLKTHMKNGDILIMENSWQIDTINKRLTGAGRIFDFKREQSVYGQINITLDSVSIFETNQKISAAHLPYMGPIAFMAGFDFVIGLICLSNPKACFGSCPTFYINEKDNFHYADAEGFSNAISPSMEYEDIDALPRVNPNGAIFTLTMKNEALETHCLNKVNLLCYPINNKEQVYHTSTGNFYLVNSIQPLQCAKGPEGEITHQLSRADRIERFSLADKENLSSKEEIFMEFDIPKKIDQGGVIIHFRQTLMTTFLIYSAIGYMGDQYSDLMARMEQSKDLKIKLNIGLKKELGSVELFLWNPIKNEWETLQGLYETGPIAINRQLISISHDLPAGKVKLKMKVNKGLWRLDYVALADIKKEVQPVEISPSAILVGEKINPQALLDLESRDRYLVSMPGDKFRIQYQLPDSNQNYQLFIQSGGYYLEWMRTSWLAEKDLYKLQKMLNHPKSYLKNEAATYKLYEGHMERGFWNSKVEFNLFSCYEK